jgi:hypothetical protein
MKITEINLLKVSILVFLLSFTTTANCQLVQEKVKVQDSLKIDGEKGQITIDSTTAMFEKKFETFRKEQEDRMDRFEKKNFILSLALMVSIIIITIIQ